MVFHMQNETKILKNVNMFSSSTLGYLKNMNKCEMLTHEIK